MHMQADQCGSKMGAKFWEVVCNEHGTGGGGEYRGDSIQEKSTLNNRKSMVSKS
jgi:tubulin beta